MVMVEPGPYRAPDGTLMWLPGFCIDLRPVTVADFTRFTSDTSCQASPAARSGDDEAAIVGWLDAMQYAHWAGKQLPTPAQLHHATSGKVIAPGQRAEWCTDPHTARALRIGAGGPATRAALRTATSTAELLELIAIQ
jgi:formylglycine-generating enzyme required for sulfatase activity